MRDYLSKALVPRLILAVDRTRWPGRLRARTSRLIGGRGRVELYFAYDDPYAAVALRPLLDVVARHRAELVLYPLIERGITGDPALAQRRQYAIVDGQRLAQRQGRALARRALLSPADTAFLAGWTEAARGHPRLAEFACAALEQIWYTGDGPIRSGDFAESHRNILGMNPPEDTAAAGAALAESARRLLKLGHWESPAARIGREWFFAHERLAQIEERLTDLGW